MRPPLFTDKKTAPVFVCIYSLTTSMLAVLTSDLTRESSNDSKRWTQLSNNEELKNSAQSGNSIENIYWMPEANA